MEIAPWNRPPRRRERRRATPPRSRPRAEPRTRAGSRRAPPRRRRGGSCRCAAARRRRLGHPVERSLGPAPEARRLLGAVRRRGRRRSGRRRRRARSRRSAARALGDPARVVHADAQAGLGEAERARSSPSRRRRRSRRRPAAASLGPRRASVLEPVRISRTRDRYMPSRTDDEPASSSSTSARATSPAPSPVLRTSSSALAGSEARGAVSPRRCAGSGSIPNESRTSAALVSGAAPS